MSRNLPHYILEARGIDGTAGQEFDNLDFAMTNFDLVAKAYADQLDPHGMDRLVLLGPDHVVDLSITDAEVAAIVREVATELRAKAVLWS